MFLCGVQLLAVKCLSGQSVRLLKSLETQSCVAAPPSGCSGQLQDFVTSGGEMWKVEDEEEEEGETAGGRVGGEEKENGGKKKS